jgi:hypothetical protein
MYDDHLEAAYDDRYYDEMDADYDEEDQAEYDRDYLLAQQELEDFEDCPWDDGGDYIEFQEDFGK